MTIAVLPIQIVLPVRTVSTLNMREHWAVRARRARQHRAATLVVPRMPVPCTVTLTRLAKRTMDGDNLQGSLKAIRDGIAVRLGVDDADPRVTWEYGQEKARGYGVRVEIVPSAMDGE